MDRGHSSAGRAVALQASGRRFDPDWLHQLSSRVRRVTNPFARVRTAPCGGYLDIVKRKTNLRCQLAIIRLASPPQAALFGVTTPASIGFVLMNDFWSSEQCTSCRKVRVIIERVSNPVRNRRAWVGIANESDQVTKGRLVNALVVRGDEGRGTLR